MNFWPLRIRKITTIARRWIPCVRRSASLHTQARLSSDATLAEYERAAKSAVQ
jgi:hypothetical protein